MDIFDLADQIIDKTDELRRRFPRLTPVVHPDDRRDPYPWLGDSDYPPDPDSEVTL